MRPSYVYDIETEDWTTFVVGALYDGATLEIYDWRKEREFTQRLLSLRGEIYAHNGGKFDHLWLLDSAFRFGMRRAARVIENSTGIIALEIGEAKFLDSYRIFPMSLKRLTNGAKHSLSDLCKCGKDCGGYCAITRKMPREIHRRVCDYLSYDVRELWEALGHFERVAKECKVELGITVGGTSWKSAAKELDLPPQPYGKAVDEWKFARKGYYGGRSEIFRTESDNGYQYDVNSMYPSKIATVPLPLDYEGKSYGANASRLYAKSRPGIYSATVKVPESFIPPLPMRSRKGRILYPFGTFDGVWTLPELEYAETRGVKVESVHEAATFARAEILFDAWVQRIFDVRMKYGKDTREGYWLKFILNSITGKFGAKASQRTFLIDPCFAGKGCTCNSHKVDDIEGWSPTGYPATSRVWYRDMERIQNCGHVEWSAYLTASARVTLHQALIEGGNEDAVYCDTDSVFGERSRRRNVGLSLGQWKCEGSYKEFIALAPKVYCYHKAEGAKVVRAKGIPNPSQNDQPKVKKFWSDLIKSRPIGYWSIAGIRNPNAEGMFFVRRFLTRKINRNTGGRLAVKRSNLTRAPSARDVKMMFE